MTSTPEILENPDPNDTTTDIVNVSWHKNDHTKMALVDDFYIEFTTTGGGISLQYTARFNLD